MDVTFRSIGANMLDPFALHAVLDSLQAHDGSESALVAASQFLESAYPEPSQASRAGTPMIVGHPQLNSPSITSEPFISETIESVPGAYLESDISSPKSVWLVNEAEEARRQKDR